MQDDTFTKLFNEIANALPRMVAMSRLAKMMNQIEIGSQTSGKISFKIPSSDGDVIINEDGIDIPIVLRIGLHHEEK